MRRAKKRKNLSSARHYDQIRFRFHTAKTHNSTGIALGDEALLAVAAEMRKIGGADCVTARIGGDEFGVVLLANCDALTAPHLRATLKSGVACSTSAAGKPGSYLRASALRYIRMTARPLASFSHRPISQCTRRSGGLSVA